MNTREQNDRLVNESIEKACGYGLTEDQINERVHTLMFGGENNAYWCSHVAMAKKYVRLNAGKIEKYCGKYGEGIKVYHPNRACRNSHNSVSNWYCVVEYVVMDEGYTL